MRENISNLKTQRNKKKKHLDLKMRNDEKHLITKL